MLALCCHEKLTSYSKKRNSIERYAHLNDSTLAIQGISDDPEFGFEESKPIMLGLLDVEKGAQNVEEYLNALLAPSGKPIVYTRLKPCCPFKTKNFRLKTPLASEFDGKYGMLEKYKVQYSDSSNAMSRILYINLYDETTQLLAPQGFAFKKR
ncbi:hypothetical protein [Ohtaekwangia sp.]|uniref:hypothetical protein n=1 Tax=Ohtaekwangia sp. TaxID=2066019 RepID=UPI002F9412AE